MADSFSQETKEQLSTLPVKQAHCRKAELSALLVCMGSYYMAESGHLFLVFQTENLAVLRRVEFLLRSVTGAEPEVHRISSKSWKHPMYSLIMRRQDKVTRLLVDLGFMTKRGVLRELELMGNTALLSRACCRRAYLRGIFMAGGFIGDPMTNYHLELKCTGAGRAEHVRRLMADEGLSAGITKRKNSFIVYLKDSGAISDFLSLTGAARSRLEFENARILRGIQGSVNRRNNCDVANLGKAASAGAAQAEAIRRIDEAIGISRLPEHLQEIAQVRFDNPEISLTELGELLHPPAGKSAVNHRLRKLQEIAAGLEEEQTGM